MLQLLFFNLVPDKLISDKKAISLKLDASNEIAKETIKELFQPKKFQYINIFHTTQKPSK
ncbi:hypothetical protein COL26_24135 [Bacillus thuringiensis]|uniref:Uncharacterized protein n=1 Tax=Bacillus thuringiensis TaxID=1428 RepID=A0ABD6RW09_BACTU|nr:hypothetical protein [Bacillus thuringiensis]PEQ47339.1 hypothetical protein CN473_24005 [Bacillus thuringiensis]PER43871.1 hypothetical protein CN495_30315 [Bacillus thuringiensis]PEU96423.1 hypothetical protein CN411_02485 [Bacillus thuringiensis]PEY71242.1 hypothetical protein CN355_20650 [Bacillus thuringiensis]PFI03271.1 hypothetical protein COI79_29490 [Bacillus thuringiensis]